MKKIYFKILNEDSSISDPVQDKKDDMSKIIVAGDSIAVGMSISALKQRGARCCGVTKFDNIVPSFPAVRGGMDSTWIKQNLLAQLFTSKDSSKPSPAKKWSEYKLIIIAGTNDAYNSAFNPKSSRWSVDTALSNIDSMAKAAKKLKMDFTVMKLAPYDPRGKYSHKAMKPEVKSRHNEFIEKFNSGISQYNNFDMIYPTADDGLHIYGSSSNRKLLSRALGSMNLTSSEIEVPTRKNQTSSPFSKKTSSDCHVNPNCNCVDRSISGEVTITSVQKALQLLKIDVDETGVCDKQTRDAIQLFQKQEQEKGFKPPDGRDFLRCDACVGPNTIAAINKELRLQNKTIQGLISKERLVKIKKARVRIERSVNASGKTLDAVKATAAQIGCHPDLIVLATVLHSEPTGRGRWFDEGFAVFNVLINRIQANGPGRGPHSAWLTDSPAWNVACNRAPSMGHQSGGWRPFASKNYPRDIKSSVEKVKEFVKKRLSIGSNIGSATFFLHTSAQKHFWNITQARIKEFGSKEAAKSAAVAEHSAAGITWNGAVKTKWPRKHPLRARWRGFGYGSSPEMVRDKWTRNYGAAPEIRVDGSTEEERTKNRKRLKRSSIAVFGNRDKKNNWSSKALSDSQIESYLQDLLEDKGTITNV